MPSQVVSIAGDTFESISRRAYGIGTAAAKVAMANPSLTPPLAAGVSVVIPDVAAGEATHVPVTDGLDVQVSGKRFNQWTAATLTRSIDKFDTLNLEAPFEPNSQVFREAFRPFSYFPITASLEGELVFTGTLINVIPLLNPEYRTAGADAYSAPGVLADCTPPAKPSPLEFENMNLRQIAESLAAPFGLAVEFTSDPGAPFEFETIPEGRRVLDVLAALAKQRGFVISNTPRGAILFRRITGQEPLVAKFREGAPGATSISPSFQPQTFFSHISGTEPVFLGTDGGTHTVENAFLRGVFRPFTFNIQGSETESAAESVEQKYRQMLANAVGYMVELPGWRNANGVLWTPGDRVKLEAPSAMVYRDTELVIASATLRRDQGREASTLRLALPGVYGGDLPEVMPWTD